MGNLCHLLWLPRRWSCVFPAGVPLSALAAGPRLPFGCDESTAPAGGGQGDFARASEDTSRRLHPPGLICRELVERACLRPGRAGAKVAPAVRPGARGPDVPRGLQGRHNRPSIVSARRASTQGRRPPPRPHGRGYHCVGPAGPSAPWQPGCLPASPSFAVVKLRPMTYCLPPAFAR